MKKSMRKGFTLVELLIVIVIIGILSSMLILSSAESAASANAAAIISDMTTIRTAALAYLADHTMEIDEAGKSFNLSKETPEVMKYLDQSALQDNNYLLVNLFSVSNGPDEDKWYVWLKVTDGRVKKKLKQRAQSLNLLTTAAATGDNGQDVLDVWSLTNTDEAIAFLYNDANVNNLNKAYVGMQIY